MSRKFKVGDKVILRGIDNYGALINGGDLLSGWVRDLDNYIGTIGVITWVNASGDWVKMTNTHDYFCREEWVEFAIEEPDEHIEVEDIFSMIL